MPLYLVRHGPAKTRDPRKWPDDRDRPLSAEGRAQTKRAAQGVVSLAPPIDRLVSSPAERAKATAVLLQSSLPDHPAIEYWEELLPGEPAIYVLEKLSRTSRPTQHVVLVGHEPTMGEVVGLSLTGDAVSIVRLSRAGAAAVEFPRRIAPGAGRLLWLVDRDTLGRLAA
ncbi:MAG: histidine phosphatase family protein [Thermoplasmata archaeon]|nr:histidine phosphatase family protein [Thermoplasmata archaeon]